MHEYMKKSDAKVHLGETILKTFELTVENHTLNLGYDLMKTQTPLNAEFLID